MEEVYRVQQPHQACLQALAPILDPYLPIKHGRYLLWTVPLHPRLQIDADSLPRLYQTETIFLDLQTQTTKQLLVGLRMEMRKEPKSTLQHSNVTCVQNALPVLTIFGLISGLIQMKDRSFAPFVEKPLRVSTTENVTKAYILARRNLSARVN
jgi:hypothetical protein